MANAEALHRVLAHIESNPEQWDQCRWHACFAGWAVRLCMPGIEVVKDDLDIEVMHDANGARLMPREIREHALSALGLSAEEADPLFSQWNSRGDLRTLVTELTVDEKVKAAV